MQLATRKQKIFIHQLVRRRGIDEDTYREMLQQRYGVRSAKYLTRAQAADFIEELLGKKRRYNLPPGAITERQLKKLEALWKQKSELGTMAALDRWLGRIFGVASRYELDYKSAGKAIGILERTFVERKREIAE